jgi:hypothetical protein
MIVTQIQFPKFCLNLISRLLQVLSYFLNGFIFPRLYVGHFNRTLILPVEFDTDILLKFPTSSLILYHIS